MYRNKMKKRFMDMAYGRMNERRGGQGVGRSMVDIAIDIARGAGLPRVGPETKRNKNRDCCGMVKANLSYSDLSQKRRRSLRHIEIMDAK